ncbi:hypothetical protein HUJ04_013477 [Dendroctonus ponderosae]|nr:hypothetical protein HUJ04_013477 [Dendroctonus ponderosae]
MESFDNFAAVQNERQPRNTATIRPETLRDMSAEQERALREAAVAVGVFGPPVSLTMALSPAGRYGQTFLPPLHQSAITREPMREPSPNKDTNDNTSDNDAISWFGRFYNMLHQPSDNTPSLPANEKKA